MGAITPIPNTRVSDQLVRQRLLSQLASDQSALFRLQSAISSGRRISVPSEDAPAAQRAISLQSLLERKQQVQVNLSTNQSFLSATDASLNSVSSVLSDIRGAALGVSDSTTTPSAKRAVAEQVDRAIQQLVDVGNQRFRGRYLFAGTRSTKQPYTQSEGLVRYSGDEGSFLSYADIDLLFATNVPGNKVFGGLSEGVEGTIDVNPQINANTRLADLRGGLGVSTGSIALSDGVNTTLLDLSGVETIGDLKDLLEANPPEGNPPTGRTVSVTLTATGLQIALDGGTLTIKEVAGGTTAAELGILAETGLFPPTLTGGDINPRLTATTRLSNLNLASPFDATSGLQVENGGETHLIDFNGAVTVEDLLNRLNGSNANVLAEINTEGTGINVRSRLSGTNFSIGENGGTTAADLGLRTFTSATRLSDLNYGFGVHSSDSVDDFGTPNPGGDDFQIRLDNGTLLNINLDLSVQKTVGDVISLINAAAGGQLTAQLAAFGNGIELVTSDTTPGGNLAVIKLNGSQAAEDLGLIPVGEAQSAAPVVDAVAGTETLTGRNVLLLEVPGVFTALARLRDALQQDNIVQIQRSIESLDQAAETLNFARAELGARQQGLDILTTRLDDEEINLEESLSQEIDADFAETVSELLARQAAFQASLQLTAQTSQLTLLDYL